MAFWPRWGLAASCLRYRGLAQRELAEHCLKHLHHCQYSGLTASLDSLAGAVGVSRTRAARLVERLEALGLVTTSGGDIRLTAEGCSDAIRVIRIHRLWEKYFADYTSLDEVLWHDEADRREHTTSDAEVKRLAEELGNPPYDPHGAPIPTASGELPGMRGIPLCKLEPYEQATIVHVEDEPAEVYAQLAAQGLTIGSVVRLLDSDSGQIRLDVAGVEQVVARIAASRRVGRANRKAGSTGHVTSSSHSIGMWQDRARGWNFADVSWAATPPPAGPGHRPRHRGSC